MSSSLTLPKAEGSEKPFSEVDVLGEVVEVIRELSYEKGSLADNPSVVNAQLKEQGLDKISVTSRHIEALVALGVLGRVISGGHSYLAWMNEGALKDSPSPINFGIENSTAVAVRSDQLAEDTKQDIETNDLFKIDVELDMEHEKLLLYRSLIVVEGIAGLLLLRQMLLWFFQL